MTEDQIPTGFRVRSSQVARVGIAVAALVAVAGAALAPDVLSILIAAGVLSAALVQWRWSGEVDPQGVRFRNPLGVDWDRRWDELRPGVRIRRPGQLGSLVRGRTKAGGFVSLPNGVVRTTDGRKLAPDTVRGLIRTWAEAGEVDPG